MNDQPVIDLEALSTALSKLKAVLRTESFLKDVKLSEHEQVQLNNADKLIDELALIQRVNQLEPPGGFITKETAQSRKNIHRIWLNLLPNSKAIGLLRNLKPLESSVKYYKELLKRSTNEEKDTIVIRSCIKVVDDDENEIDFSHITDLRKLIEENPKNVRLNYIVFMTDGEKPKFKDGNDVLDDMRPCSPCDNINFTYVLVNL